ncbi:MAG: hypothetical protein WD960_11585 [Gemmatimonadota bacterium]
MNPLLLAGLALLQVQSGPDGWNAPEVLALVDQGREARQALAQGGDLENYRALTEGHVYFYVDPEAGERSLIRVDQIAVELRWEAPDRVHQRVLGQRSETRLPVRDFRYYLDRLTLVQYGFGDEIEVGSGLDVAGVPHPLAPVEVSPGGPRYDYRATDSLTLSLPGRAEPLRLTEVQVRPRDPDSPGIVGTLLLDRATGSIVRMRFTFTPASYVDRRTDRIEIEVDYGLWEGRYWLPNRQEINVRREIPELDLGVGTAIRAVLRVGEYELNVPGGPGALGTWTGVSWAPEEERTAYPFTEGLLDGIERDGLAAVELRPDAEALRRQAVELLARRPPTGLPRARPHLPGLSSLVRYNRAEGAFVGVGGSYVARGSVRVRARGGWSFGRSGASGGIAVSGPVGSESAFFIEGRLAELDDLGLTPGAAGVTSSIGGALRAEDYLDPVLRSDATAGLEMPLGDDWILRLDAGYRRDRSPALRAESAPLDRTRVFRPIRPVDEGDFGTASLRLGTEVEWPAGGRGLVHLQMEGTAGGPGVGAALEGEATGRWASPTGARELDATLYVRSWRGDPLPQGHRLVGGRGSLPGYPFRGWGGRDHILGSLVGVTDLAGPLVRVRGGLHAGWSARPSEAVAEAWGVGATAGVRPAVTLGLGVGWDLVRVEGARGLRDGEWQLLLSLDPRWWDRL